MNAQKQPTAQKNGLYIVRLAGILLLISALTALLLGLVNYITSDKIAEIRAQKIASAIAEVLPGDYEVQPLEADWPSPVTAVYSAVQSGTEVGYVVEVVVAGSQDSIDMMVGLDPAGTVTGVTIVEMSETPGLGDKASDASWLLQFVGADGGLAVSKDGGTIDALTGATVTSRAVTEGVNAALETAQTLLN